jgi:uncharacterized protein YbjT (DUF2867 family)
MISAPVMDMVETQSTFIDVSKAAGVRHVIKFSGLDARPDTTFPFGIMHEEIEEYLEKSGLAWTQLRPTGFACKNICAKRRVSPKTVHSIWRSAT